MQILLGLSPGSRPFEKVSKKTLAFPPVLLPPGGLVLPIQWHFKKKAQPNCMAWTSPERRYNPLSSTSHLLFFGIFLTLIRAPLPTQISRTVGTLPSSYTRHTFHSWGLKSFFACGNWLAFALWSRAQLHINDRLFAPPFGRDSGWTSVRGCWPICWCGTTRGPLL